MHDSTIKQDRMLIRYACKINTKPRIQGFIYREHHHTMACEDKYYPIALA